MIDANDVPACPACGSRRVHPVQGRDNEVLFACGKCGRDNSEAWKSVQPAPPVKPLIGSPGHANEDIDEIGQSDQLAKSLPDPNGLGICAELKGKT